MEQFLQQVRDILVRMGIKNVTSDHDSISVAGCYVDCYSHRRGRYHLRGESFTSSQAHLAAQHLIKELPAMMQEKAESEKHSQMWREARDINRYMEGSKLEITANGGEYILKFKHEDMPTIRAAADHLQEHGFCDPDSERMDDPIFVRDQAYRFLNSVPEQDQYELVRYMMSKLSSQARHILYYNLRKELFEDQEGSND